MKNSFKHIIQVVKKMHAGEMSIHHTIDNYTQDKDGR